MLMVSRIFYIFALIISSTLFLIIFFRSRENKVNQSFGMVVICVFLWIFVRFFSDNPNIPPTLNLFWSNLALVPPLFIGSFFLYFSLVFIGKKPLSKMRKFLIFAPAFLFFPFIFTPLNVKEVVFNKGRLEFTPGILYLFFFIYISLFIGIATYRLFKASFKARGYFKLQLKYIALGACISTVLAVSFDAILPFFGTSQFYSIGPPVAIFFLGFIAYAIIKHRLMDIRLAVARSVAYSFLVAIIAGFFVFTISYLKQFYHGFMSQNMAFIIAGFVAAFGFQPLRRFLEKATDKIFAKGRYDFKALLGNLSQIFSTKVILEDLTKATLKTLTREMRLRRAAFIVTASPEISEVKQLGYKGVPKYNWEKAVSLVKNKRKMIVSDELEEGSNEKELLRKLNTEVLLPLSTENEMVGLLALGEKSSGDMFTSEDLRLLEVIAPQAAIALKNAARQKEIISQVIEERERIQKKAQQKIYLKLESLAGEAEQSLNKPLLKRKKALLTIEGGLRKAVSELQEIVLGTS